jgi:hypothetical protein
VSGAAIGAPAIGGNTSKSIFQPNSSCCLDTFDAYSIRVFGENPGIQHHPSGWTRVDTVDAMDVGLQ